MLHTIWLSNIDIESHHFLNIIHTWLIFHVHVWLAKGIWIFTNRYLQIQPLSCSWSYTYQARLAALERRMEGVVEFWGRSSSPKLFRCDMMDLVVLLSLWFSIWLGCFFRNLTKSNFQWQTKHQMMSKQWSDVPSDESLGVSTSEKMEIGWYGHPFKSRYSRPRLDLVWFGEAKAPALTACEYPNEKMKEKV